MLLEQAMNITENIDRKIDRQIYDIILVSEESVSNTVSTSDEYYRKRQIERQIDRAIDID